jgi:hypothetical protein
VPDVPEQAVAVAFGVLLAGPGVIRLGDLRFEVVKRTVPEAQQPSPRRPQNLDFAEAG